MASQLSPKCYCLKDKMLLVDKDLPELPKAHSSCMCSFSSWFCSPWNHNQKCNHCNPVIYFSLHSHPSLIFQAVLFLFLNDFSDADTCLTWNRTDTGVQALLETSRKIKWSRVCRFTDSLDQVICLQKWTSAKLYINTAWDRATQKYSASLTSLVQAVFWRSRGWLQCVRTWVAACNNTANAI